MFAVLPVVPVINRKKNPLLAVLLVAPAINRKKSPLLAVQPAVPAISNIFISAPHDREALSG